MAESGDQIRLSDLRQARRWRELRPFLQSRGAPMSISAAG